MLWKFLFVQCIFLRSFSALGFFHGADNPVSVLSKDRGQNEHPMGRRVSLESQHVLALSPGGDLEEDSILRFGGGGSKVTQFLWYIPVAVFLVSFWSYRWLVNLFLAFAQWTSHNAWIPLTDAAVNLQTNIVTQVVNGPVITSISVLFASLVGLTISNLHMRQVDIHKSFVLELQSLRLLQNLVNSQAAVALFEKDRIEKARELVYEHERIIFSGKFSTPLEREKAHPYIESVLPALLVWCYEQELPQVQNHKTFRSSQQACSAQQRLNALILDYAHKLMDERKRRWLALKTVAFPQVHYITLGLLAASIMISFLVAVGQAKFVGRSYPARFLWCLLTTSFSALGVVCFDMAKPFGGAYHIL